MTATTASGIDTLVDAVIGHAAEHYSDGGWDVIVECWTRDEIAAGLRRANVRSSKKAAIEAFAGMVAGWADQEAEADQYEAEYDEPHVDDIDHDREPAWIDDETYAAYQADDEPEPRPKWDGVMLETVDFCDGGKPDAYGWDHVEHCPLFVPAPF